MQIMKPLFFLPFVVFFSSCLQAQNQTELKFTQAWVWEYENELIAVGEPERQGEMVVYFNPDLNYWLFNFESYGNSGEMFEWILGKPDGTYLIYGKDEFGKTVWMHKELEFIQNENLPEYYKKNQNQKVFNDFPDLGFEKITGAEFQMNYEKTEGKSVFYLTEFDADFSAVYHFNQLNLEAKIPFHFPIDLPKNQLVLEMNYVNKENLIQSKVKFKYISQTEYFIQLPE